MTKSSTAFLFDSMLSDIGLLSSAVYSIISSTVRMGSRVSNCSTYPVYRLRYSRVGVMPPNRICVGSMNIRSWMRGSVWEQYD